MTYDDYISTDVTDVDAAVEDRGPQVCRRCGCDCEEGDWCAVRKAFICARCDDPRNSVPDDYSGEAA